MKQQKVKLELPDGTVNDALAPVVLSVSRSTDIPALYGEWFRNRVRSGYSVWINPFNKKPSWVSYEKVRAIVFWTKNPRPFIKYLDEIAEFHPNFYFQYTCNDYESERLEPGIPSLKKRIKSFQELSQKLGPKKVIWRFDPVLLAANIDSKEILKRISYIGERLADYTEKLVFSFIDISAYRKVSNNIKNAGLNIYEADMDSVKRVAEGLVKLNQKWGLSLATCGELIDLHEFGIEHNRCIDDVLMKSIFSHDEALMNFLGHNPQLSLFNGDSESVLEPNSKLKDKGQRAACGCIVSKDIGSYNTCTNGCLYCYANSSRSLAARNYAAHSPDNETLI